MAIWQQHPDFMAWLLDSQNHPAHEGQDIMSFAGMCSTFDELHKHCWAAERRCMAWDDARVAA